MFLDEISHEWQNTRITSNRDFVEESYFKEKSQRPSPLADQLCKTIFTIESDSWGQKHVQPHEFMMNKV